MRANIKQRTNCCTSVPLIRNEYEIKIDYDQERLRVNRGSWEKKQYEYKILGSKVPRPPCEVKIQGQKKSNGANLLTLTKTEGHPIIHLWGRHDLNRIVYRNLFHKI